VLGRILKSRKDIIVGGQTVEVKVAGRGRGSYTEAPCSGYGDHL
jgi:hypothetical protein